MNTKLERAKSKFGEIQKVVFYSDIKFVVMANYALIITWIKRKLSLTL